MALPDLSSVITPKQVKIQLGVDDTDILDEKIVDSGAYDELLLDYFGWFPKFMDLLNDSTGTPEVQMQQIAIKSYGKFFVCHRIALSGPLSFFQKIGDGENGDSRFKIDWDEEAERLLSAMNDAKAKTLGIATDHTPEEPSQLGSAVFAISSPSVDVVRR